MNTTMNKSFLIVFVNLFFSLTIFSEGAVNQKVIQNRVDEPVVKFLLLRWMALVREKGSSTEIVKEHFPEAFEIIEKFVISGEGINEDSAIVLFNVMQSATDLLKQLDDEGKFEFPKRSKEQSCLLLSELIFDFCKLLALKNKISINMAPLAVGGVVITGIIVCWKYFHKK